MIISSPPPRSDFLQSCAHEIPNSLDSSWPQKLISPSISETLTLAAEEAKPLKNEDNMMMMMMMMMMRRRRRRSRRMCAICYSCYSLSHWPKNWECAVQRVSTHSAKRFLLAHPSHTLAGEMHTATPRSTRHRWGCPCSSVDLILNVQSNPNADPREVYRWLKMIECKTATWLKCMFLVVFYTNQWYWMEPLPMLVFILSSSVGFSRLVAEIGTGTMP